MMSGILVRSGSHLVNVKAEMSGSTSSYLYSESGPFFASATVATTAKSDVVNAGVASVTGVGNVYTMPDRDGANPCVVFLRTQLPAHCDGNWHINCEVQLGHASGSPQSGRKVQLSWAGRLSPDNVVISSNKNSGNSGEWTGSTQAVYDSQNSNFRLKNPGWYPFAITGVGSAPNTDFPVTVPTSAGAFTTVTSRYIKLSDFVNNGESASSFKQGAVLDIVVGRDLDPVSDDLGGIDLRIASIKIRFCPLSSG